MRFRNLENGHVEKLSSSLSWLWVFLFGPIYWVVRGVWNHALIHFLLGALTLGVAHLVYAFLTYSILRKHFLRKGWQEVSEEEWKSIRLAGKT